MAFSPPTLHPPVAIAPGHLKRARDELLLRSRAFQLTQKIAAPPSDQVLIPLTTVSRLKAFDAYIDVSLKGAPPGSAEQLLVDSGNSTLIYPRWETIAALPGAQANYKVLGQAQEPWGCPCNIVQGPIELTTLTNSVLTIPDVVFYACTADANGERTANFGAACLSPWTANGWNTPPGLATPMLSPLAYFSTYPFAEFSYAPAAAVLTPAATPRVASGSVLALHRAEPPGFKMFDVLRNDQHNIWMALRPLSLSIGGTLTHWPKGLTNPLAIVDTGGTCVFLSDPNGDLYTKQWPDPVSNPDWAKTSDHCETTAHAITIELGDAGGSYTYTIDPSKLAPSVRGQTLVMCRQNAFMMKENGMNIGGISALINSILIDFKKARVGFKAR